MLRAVFQLVPCRSAHWSVTDMSLASLPPRQFPGTPQTTVTPAFDSTFRGTGGYSTFSMASQSLPQHHHQHQRRLTQDDRADIAAAFAKWCEPDKRMLSKRGLKLAMISVLGYKPASFEVKTLFGENAVAYTCVRKHPARPTDNRSTAKDMQPESGREEQVNSDPEPEPEPEPEPQPELEHPQLGVDERAFVRLMEQKMRHLQGPDHRLRETFRQFGGEKGYITVEDLLAAFEKVAPATNAQLVRRVFREFDTRGTGMVSYLEFERIFRL